METGKQPENEIRQKYKKYKLKKMGKYGKQEGNGGNIGNCMEPGNQNEIKLMKIDGEFNGEDSGATWVPKRKRCGNLKPNTDTTNDSLCNNSSGASKNNDNDKNM